MHEVSLVHALFDEVDRHAADHPGARVRLVRVRLGDASGVEPELFRTAFDGTRDERGHGDATLEVVAEPEAWRCAECARPIPRGAVLQCPACGAAAQLVGGDALFLDHLELEVPTGAPAPPGTRR